MLQARSNCAVFSAFRFGTIRSVLNHFGGKRAVGQPVPGPEGPSLWLVVQHVLEIVVRLGKIGLAGADPAPHGDAGLMHRLGTA